MECFRWRADLSSALRGSPARDKEGETVQKFFMERSASLWTAAFCIVAGVILVLYPVAVSNMFVTALAIGALVYGLIHLFRYIQGRRAGIGLTGDTF